MSKNENIEADFLVITKGMAGHVFINVKKKNNSVKPFDES